MARLTLERIGGLVKSQYYAWGSARSSGLEDAGSDVRHSIRTRRRRVDPRYCMQYHIRVAISYVLDTGVLVAAMRSSSGASRQLLLHGLEQHFAWLLSVPLWLEYEAVLSRPEHLAAAGINHDELGQILSDIAAVGATCIPVAPVPDRPKRRHGAGDRSQWRRRGHRQL